MKPQDLFRQEAIEHSQTRVEGEVTLTNAPSFASIMVGISVVLTVAILLVTLVPFSNYTQVKGIISNTAGTIKVFAPQDAVVDVLLVEEGEQVSPGAPLIILRQPILTGESGNNRAAMSAEVQLQIDNITLLKQQKQEAYSITSEEYRRKISAIQKRATTLEQKAIILGERIAIAQEIYSKQQELLSSGGISQLDIASSKQETLRLQETLHDQRINIMDAREELANLKSAQLRSHNQLTSDIASLDNEASDLRQLLLTQQLASFTQIDAHRGGIVSNINVNAGETVTTQLPLLTLAPDQHTLQAELFIPGRAIGFVKQGQAVRMRVDAYPTALYGELKGEITQVSPTLMFPGEWPNPLQISEPVYRAFVFLDIPDYVRLSPAIQLRSGLSLEADIVLEKMTLIEYVLSPLRALKSRFD